MSETHYICKVFKEPSDQKILERIYKDHNPNGTSALPAFIMAMDRLVSDFKSQYATDDITDDDVDNMEEEYVESEDDDDDTEYKEGLMEDASLTEDDLMINAASAIDPEKEDALREIFTTYHIAIKKIQVDSRLSNIVIVTGNVEISTSKLTKLEKDLTSLYPTMEGLRVRVSMLKLAIRILL